MRMAGPHGAAPFRWLVVAVIVALGGCASTPGGRSAALPGIDGSRDGPDANPPTGLEQVPDAQPRIEAIRVGGPNKPYDALGRTYVPMTQDQPFYERGLASWYGRKFHGRRTSSGEPYDMYAMTAAHPTLPIPSYARVRNPANGREIVVRVNDRGPFHEGRVIDLSYTAALKLDLLRGVAPVEVERITFDEIRAGTWRRAAPDDARDARLPTPGAGVVAVVVPSATTVAVAARGDEMRTARTPPTPVAAAPAAQAESDGATSGAVAPPSQPEGVIALPSKGYWVQLGAFRERAGALDFQRRVADALGWISPRLVVVDDAVLFRLQAGPYPTREEARGAADGVRSALSLVPVIVERR